MGKIGRQAGFESRAMESGLSGGLAMEGILRKRRQLPAVLRSFAPTRLADEVLAGVYERLLSGPEQRLATASMMVMDDDVPADCPLGQLPATGGRYE
jgi:hypothetical protein